VVAEGAAGHTLEKGGKAERNDTRITKGTKRLRGLLGALGVLVVRFF
jgi:hypothetical protein